jgi:ABC-2 type transport system ATP-binding protein
MTPIVELDDLTVRFGKRTILDRLSGSLSSRAIGLLGPNGAGKTTLVHTLLGFHPPTTGTARIFGEDIRTHAKSIRARIGYMPERDSFISDMTCVGFTCLMGELSGLPPRAALERAHESLFYVGLGESRYRKLGTYSLGMKQLAKLAQALVHAPKLIFLDEPTNGLDPPARKRMLELIREIRDSNHAQIILSSHLLHDVEECCEDILVLKDGRIVERCNLEAERNQNRRFLEMETRGGHTARFAEAVRALGCEYAFTDVLPANVAASNFDEAGAPLSSDAATRRVKVVLRDGVEVGDLYSIAAREAVQIRRLDYKRTSLEDIFLRAMDKPGAEMISTNAGERSGGQSVHGSL